MRVRLVTGLAAIAVALVASGCMGARPVQADGGRSCGEEVVKNDRGLTVQVLFAKNGAVQRYVLVGSRKNYEEYTELVLALEKRYGRAGVDAPPLQIVTFKNAPGGLQVPDKAVDSCGRKLSFE